MGVEIAAAALKQTRATIGAIEDDRFAVLPDAQATPVWLAYSDVVRIRPVPLSVGAKAGIGAAVGTVGWFVITCLTRCFG